MRSAQLQPQRAAGFGDEDRTEVWTQRINDIMDEMLKRSFFKYRDGGTWQPATNVYETQDKFYIVLELSGIKGDDVEVKCVDERRVLIRGRRDQPRPRGVDGPLSVHSLEIDEGPFSREIELPERIDVEAVEASYSKGYLWVSLPRTKRPPAKT
jgi:HSP20 family protein